MFRDAYKEVPLTGCQLCIAPHYLLPQSFCQRPTLGPEGESASDGVPSFYLPWEFHSSGELQHFCKTLAGDVASGRDFHDDALAFEQP